MSDENQPAPTFDAARSDARAIEIAMMPMGTPPNALAFASGQLHVPDIAKRVSY